MHALDLLVVVLDEEPECARPPIARLPADVAFQNLTTAAGLAVDRRVGELADAEEPGTRVSAVHRALKAVRRFECLLAVSDQDSPVRAWRRLLEEHRAADLAMRP